MSTFYTHSHLFYLLIVTVAVNYRLPNNTKPETYDIKLATNIHEGDFNFTGSVKINFKVLESVSNEITLHVSNLTIDSVELFGNSSIKSSFREDNTNDFLIITSQQTLEENVSYSVEIKYHGVLQVGSKGFFKASYVNAKGEKK